MRRATTTNEGNPRLQQRHYEFIAEVISRMEEDRAVKRRIALAFVMRCKADNPKFKPTTFMKACGLSETETA